MWALETHGLLPILARALDVPEDVRRLVLEARLRAATYQTNTLEALNEIAREMKAAGIPFAVLKGTYLYELLYRDLFSRAYGDIDLLVPADRIEDAASALGRAGYDGNRLLWFLDIELFLRKHKDLLDWPAVAERMQRWNVSDDMMNCLGVLRVLRPGSQAEYALERLGCRSLEADSTRSAPAGGAGGAQPAQRQGTLDRVLRSATGQALLERSMLVNPRLLVRPIRLFLMWRLLAPSPTRLLRYHGRRLRLWVPWLYIIHPFHMLRKLLVP